MIFRIPSGKHRGRPFRFGIWWRRPVFTWQVTFDQSCRYDLKSVDQGDYNKLIGIGYLWHHHKDSARFGWRYWPDTGQIELSAYCYISGRRTIYHIALVEIGRKCRLQLNVTKLAYVFDVYDLDAGKSAGGCSLLHLHRKRLQYRLGLYFGGNAVAPNEMSIQLKRI